MKVCVIGAAGLLAVAVPAAAQDSYAQIYSDFGGPNEVMTVVTSGPDAGLVRLEGRDSRDAQFWVSNETGDGWLVLSSLEREGEFCLDVVNGGDLNGMVEMAPCQRVSGQHWQVTEVGGGKVEVHTEFLGPSMCLDVVNGGEFDGYLWMTPCNGYSGQVWTAEEFVD